jgi:hypothetical protein
VADKGIAALAAKIKPVRHYCGKAGRTADYPEREGIAADPRVIDTEDVATPRGGVDGRGLSDPPRICYCNRG